MAKLDQTIYLVGMMGSGKTYRAKKLAAFFEVPWFDTDLMIEKETGKTIIEIFAEAGGEARFRQMEHDLLQRRPWPAASIIACGGGMPCFHQNIDLMLESGLVVWLDPELPILSHRLWNERRHRPVLAALDSQEALEARLGVLMDERRSSYAMADIKVVGNPTDSEFLKVIMDSFA